MRAFKSLRDLKTLGASASGESDPRRKKGERRSDRGRERERCKVHRSELLLLDIYIILIIG